jgi:hypothetical protein
MDRTRGALDTGRMHRTRVSSRRRAALLLVLAPVLFTAARGARAEDPVPDVPAQRLPVAGTCAPIDEADATFVIAGETDHFRVRGRPGTLDEAGLARVLAERTPSGQGPPAGGRHAVWILAAADLPGRPAWKAVLVARNAGIGRVGLVVRSEAGGGGLLGFPLFVPPPAPQPATPGRARRMVVAVEANAKVPSDARHLFTAARRATEKFGATVADVTVHGAVRLGETVRCVDMLYRGGCVAVKVSFRGLLGRWKGDPDLRVLLQGRELAGVSEAVTVDVPPAMPRKAPWGDDGAAQPGAFLLALEDLPGEASGEHAPRVDVLESYAGAPGGVPPEMTRAADAEILAWSRGLATDLGEATKGRPVSPGRVIQRFSVDPGNLARLLAPARETFPNAERVQAATLHVAAYLFRGAEAVGKVDVTFHLGLLTPSVIFASWVSEEYPKNLFLAPRLVDPFAAGVPGHLRVRLEGLLADARRGGAAALPLAPEAEVLRLLPAVAHAGVRQQLAARGAQIDALQRWLQATPYDRLVLLAPDATVAVGAEGRITGILRAVLEAEARELKISSLTARAAPR